ncbi:MAG: ATP-binding cassette domain-containing protein [Caulobacter sp.]|nr:ATP-binding cassette domain-containing protein [Caulobacter sp.]
MRPPILALKDVRLVDGASTLFDGADLALEPGARACLVGRNGAGKSTLMRLLTGQIAADAGERFASPAARISVVPQEPRIEGETLLAYATTGGALPHEAEATLEELGLDPQRGTSGLSGGEIRRAALARMFAEAPDVMLLDEPTNHLDILAIETLERMLRSSRGAALIVSHDRAFLERTTNRCFWLESRRVRRLDKGFAHFDDWADRQLEAESEEMRRLNAALVREEHWMQRGVTARRARNEGRRRRLVSMREEKATAMRDSRKSLSMDMSVASTSGKRVAEAKGLSKAFGDKVLVQGFSTRIQRGDRIAIVGPNGAGKTTLVKLLLGQIAPDAGEVVLGTNLQIAYIDQARADLDINATLWEALAPGGGDQVMVGGQPRHIAGYAKDFLFRDSQLRQPVSTLSGGERARLLLARALATPANLLVLDEPTNDLDMETLDLLEDLLAAYVGTLLLVSHDRDFIDRLASSTIGLDGRGGVVETPGGWSDFMTQNPGFFSATGPLVADAVSPSRAVEPRPAAPVKKLAKLTYKDQRRLEELEGLVASLPAEITRIEAVLADPGLYARDVATFDRTMKTLGDRRAELARCEDEWLALEEKREQLAAQ